MEILSWIACAFSVLGKISVNHKWRANFIFFLCGYAAWIIWNISTRPNPPMIIMYCVYTVLSIRGWFVWGKDSKRQRKE